MSTDKGKLKRTLGDKGGPCGIWNVHHPMVHVSLETVRSLGPELRESFGIFGHVISKHGVNGHELEDFLVSCH